VAATGAVLRLPPVGAAPVAAGGIAASCCGAWAAPPPAAAPATAGAVALSLPAAVLGPASDISASSASVEAVVHLLLPAVVPLLLAPSGCCPRACLAPPSPGLARRLLRAAAGRCMAEDEDEAGARIAAAPAPPGRRAPLPCACCCCVAAALARQAGSLARGASASASSSTSGDLKQTVASGRLLLATPDAALLLDNPRLNSPRWDWPEAVCCRAAGGSCAAVATAGAAVGAAMVPDPACRPSVLPVAVAGRGAAAALAGRSGGGVVLRCCRR